MQPTCWVCVWYRGLNCLLAQQCSQLHTSLTTSHSLMKILWSGIIQRLLWPPFSGPAHFPPLLVVSWVKMKLQRLLIELVHFQACLFTGCTKSLPLRPYSTLCLSFSHKHCLSDFPVRLTHWQTDTTDCLFSAWASTETSCNLGRYRSLASSRVKGTTVEGRHACMVVQ